MALKKTVAIDCEMVGSGNQSLLARVSIVDSSGRVIYDEYVKPTATVTDYRTPISGIRKVHLDSGKEFSQVQSEVCSLLKFNNVVGHSLNADFLALGLSCPESYIRDLAKYFMKNGQSQTLKDLAQMHLNKTIQVGAHDSVTDARTAMQLYNLVASNWK